jgi:hypothetical protein
MNRSIDQFEISENDFCQGLARLATDDETAAFSMDEGPVLKTVWTVYDRVFADGQREICATRTTRILQKGPLAMPNRAKRGESVNRESNVEDSAKRAKQAVRLRAKEIGADRMLTLTYRDNMQDMERLKRDWKAFVRRMSKCKSFHYVATFERQQRGAWHIHVAVRGRQMFQLVRSIWRNVIGNSADGQVGGNVHVRNPVDFGFGKNGTHKLAAYIAKYIGKDIAAHEINKKHYWSSRGIVLPEKNYYQLPYGTTESEAYAYVLQLAADHNNDDMAFFSNSPLGVCWVATAPTD